MIATQTVSDIVFDEMQDFVKELCSSNARWFWPGLDSDIENADGKHYRPLNAEGIAPDYSPRDRSQWIRVGCTGFDLIKQSAMYATFEFDVGHSDNAITEEQRNEIIAKLAPYCDLVNSTGANGIHGRIWFDCPISCTSRKEYSQLCEAAIKVLEKISGFKFAHLVESTGCLLWLASVNQVDYEYGSDRTSFEPISDSNATIASDDVLASLDELKAVSNDNRIAKPDAGDCLRAMLRIRAKDAESDGSKRLLAVCCRAVEYNLDDNEAVHNVRLYEQQQAFPRVWTDAEILTRIRSAEEKVVRGSAKLTISMPMDFAPMLATMEQVLSERDVFQRAGTLVHIVPGPNGPRIEDIHSDAIIAKLAEAADFRGRNRKGDDIEMLPTKQAQRALHSLGKYDRIRRINGVANHPILLPNGDIVTESGFHEGSGYFLQIDRSYPELMATSEAVELLLDLLHDFPFSSPEEDQAAVLAYILTLAVRNCINGQTPVFAFDGNRPGVGKGLLASLGVMIVFGRQAANYPGCSDDVEMRKLLISVARSGERYIIFDNVKGVFGGPSLESVATTGLIAGRILGQSRDATYPFNLTMVVTANGYIPTEDMVRRTITVTLDSDSPTPHLRNGFRHSDLLAYANQKHPELLIAALSVVSNHIKSGKPHGLGSVGSFDDWNAMIRAAIINAGLADPCSSLIDRSSDVTEIPSDLLKLVRSWRFEGPVLVKDVLHATESAPELHVDLVELLKSTPASQTPARHLGNLLRQAIGHVIEGKEFIRSGNKTKRWELKDRA